MPTLNWIGKDAVVNHHHDVPFRTLDAKYTFGAETSENKIIHGDNLEALKALLPEYEGRVRCIYIDPPYNTGNENWVYNDNVNSPKIKKWLGQVVGKEAEDLTRHDKWLCMMYPRLKLLHQLLADDGAIFISIDDNEQANLKLICDEIFGAGNFIGIFKWNRVAKAPSLTNSIRTKYEYVIAYKKKELSKLYGKESYNTMGPLWHNPNKQKELVFPPNSVIIPKSFSKGYYSEKYQVELLDNVEEYQGKNKNQFIIKACSAWGQDKINEYVKQGNYFVVKKDFATVYTQMNPEGNYIAPSDLLSNEECGVGTNTDACDMLRMMNIDFDYSKPVSLIQYLINTLVHFDKSSIILDSFAGSGTTAHAVLNLNKQDGGNRKFILVEMEDYAENITAERVRRVIGGYGEGKNAVEGTGGSFTYYELGEPIFADDQNLNESIGTEKLREYIWYSETRTPYRKVGNSYLLGNHDGTDYYFYYEPNQITTLTHETLSIVERQADTYVVYADQCLIDKEWLNNHHIIFKKIPRDIRRF